MVHISLVPDRGSSTYNKRFRKAAEKVEVPGFSDIREFYGVPYKDKRQIFSYGIRARVQVIVWCFLRKRRTKQYSFRKKLEIHRRKLNPGNNWLSSEVLHQRSSLWQAETGMYRTLELESVIWKQC